MPPKKLNLPKVVTHLEYSADKTQIQNPKTGKWVNVDGDTGKALLELLKKHKEKAPEKKPEKKEEEEEEEHRAQPKKLSARMSQMIQKDIDSAVVQKINTIKDEKASDLGSDYTDWKELGRGAFGVTFSAKHGDRTVVIKRLQKHGRVPEQTEAFKEMFNIEQIILEHVQHWCKEFLVCYVDAKESFKFYYLIMEFLGTFRVMESYIDDKKRAPLSPSLARTIIRNCLGALRVLEEAKVVHRDIKPANIMIDTKTGQVKLIDFGLSQMKKGIGLEGNPVGSPDYLDPDITTKYENKEEFTYDEWVKSDLWSMGLTIFELLTGVVFSRAFFNTHLDEIERVAYKDERKRTFEARHPDLRTQDVLLARYFTERGKNGQEEIPKDFFYSYMAKQKQFSAKDVADFYRVFAALTNLDPDRRVIPDL